MIQLYNEILTYRAKTHPDRVALVCEDVSYTYAELYTNALKSAQWLQSQQLKKGDHIGLLDFNNAAYVHIVNGCLLSGIIPVSINWRLSVKEMLFILTDSNCQLFVYGNDFKQVGDEIAATNNFPVIHTHDCFHKIQQLTIDTTFVLPTITLSEQALIIYTSGTTGNPKGVLLSHSNLFEMYYALRSETPLFGPGAVNLIAGPWYAVVGVGYFVFGVFSGCTNVLLKIFDPIEILRLIQTYKITNAFFAPIMMKIICALDEVHEYDLSSLQNIQYGGSPIDEEQLRICYNTFKCHFTQGYGLTETSGIATALRFDDHLRIMNSNDPELKHLLRSAGKPYAGVEIKIVDEANTSLPVNAIGEVSIKGNVVAMGYKNQSAINNKIFGHDGWFYTGDMGYVDENGYLFLVDRKNDMIISKGQNIYPAEIEQIIIQHPEIKDIAIIGVPHEVYGEAICAIVVVKKENIPLNELRNWAKDKMPEYKLPAVIEIVDELPRNPTGKVLRKLLREKYWINKQRRIN